MIYINYLAILTFSKQLDIINFTTTSINNKKLIRALKYISAFEINLLYKLGRKNIIPNMFLRILLPNISEPTRDSGFNILLDN